MKRLSAESVVHKSKEHEGAFEDEKMFREKKKKQALWGRAKRKVWLFNQVHWLKLIGFDPILI